MVNLTTLFSFSGPDGATPQNVTLLADATGNLFGTTRFGGSGNPGVVFELPKTASGYASTSITLATFNGSSGSIPAAGLVADAGDNLFGVTQSGGTSNGGTVFEIAKTVGGYASTPITLASFTGANGNSPVSALIADANGDLFGTTDQGGASNNGTVFEIAKTAGGYASTFITLVSFTGANGGFPTGKLIADAKGDLFGTTQLGGASNNGTVFEIVNTAGGYASTPTTLVNFNGTNVLGADAGLITDASGDLFGTSRNGGANDAGTVFEIVKTVGGYASTPSVLASFNVGEGGPGSELIADANGNLFGTTLDGMVFKVAKTASGYASTPTSLVSGLSRPGGGLIADASGNLFGTSRDGGTVGDGTVFEVTGTGFVGAPVTIANTVANQPTTDAAVLLPFAGVTVTTAVANAYSTATVTLSAAANGALSNPGIGNLGAGGASYTVSGTATDIQAALRALVFTPTNHEVPVGTAATTGLSLAVTDAYGSATDATTSVVATALDTPPTITDTSASQNPVVIPTTALPAPIAIIQPFAYMTLAEPDAGASLSTTITLTQNGVASDAEGTLSGPSLTKTGVGAYALAGATVAGETVALQGLTFSIANPYAQDTIGVALTVSDGIGAPVTSTSTLGIAANPGGSSVVTNSSQTMTVYNDTPSTNATHDYATTIEAVLNGSIVLYDQTFTLPYSDPAVQNAVAQAQAALANAGGSAAAPAQTASGLTSSSTQTTVTQTGSSGPQPAGTEPITSATNFGPAIIGPGVSVPLVGQTNARAYFDILAGQTDVNFNGVYTVTISRNVTTISTDLLTQQYTLFGSTADAYTIAGAQAAQPTNDVTALSPFAALTIANPANTAGTATVTLSAANGTLSNLGAGTLGNNGLTYTATEPPPPSRARCALSSSPPPTTRCCRGKAKTTGFALTVADTAGTSGNATTSVVATALPVGAPAVASPTLTVAENSGPAPIGIAAPTDPSFAPGQLTLAALSLPAGGTVTLADGVTAVAAGQALTAAQLTGLLFTPTPGQFGCSSTFTYKATDPEGNATTGTATLAIGPALGNPVVSSPALTVIANAAATPIGIAVPTDPNYAAAQLAITAVALPTDGTITLADGRTAVAAGQALTAAQLTTLLFTPTPGPSGASSAFTYTVRDPAGNTAAGSAALAIGISSNPFAPLLLSSASSTAAFTVSVATRPATGGTFSTLGGGSVGPDGATYTVTGTVAQVNAALTGLVLTVPPGAPAVTGSVVTLSGSAAPGQLTDTSGLASLLTAASANETLQAGTGADTLTALGAADVLIGGPGKDVLVGSTAGSTLLGGSGSSTFFALGGQTILVGVGALDVVSATGGTPVVFTAPGGHTLVTLGAGPAVVDGLGADTITAGSGSLLAVAAANSTVFLGSGASTVLAGQGDMVVGGAGPTFVGMRGSSLVLTAGSGLTEFLGDTGSDTVTGGVGGSAILFAGKGGGSYSGGTGATTSSWAGSRRRRSPAAAVATHCSRWGRPGR